jgi:hypothetical protein
LREKSGGVGWIGGFPCKEEVAMRIRMSLVVTALSLLVPGCASMNSHQMATYDDGYDHAYMAQVEKAAEESGTQIIWVNPPKAKNGKP